VWSFATQAILRCCDSIQPFHLLPLLLDWMPAEVHANPYNPVLIAMQWALLPALLRLQCGSPHFLETRQLWQRPDSPGRRAAVQTDAQPKQPAQRDVLSGHGGRSGRPTMSIRSARSSHNACTAARLEGSMCSSKCSPVCAVTSAA